MSEVPLCMSLTAAGVALHEGGRYVPLLRSQDDLPSLAARNYRGTLLIKKGALLGPHRRLTPRVIWARYPCRDGTVHPPCWLDPQQVTSPATARQGYLAHKKHPPPRTLPYAYA